MKKYIFIVTIMSFWPIHSQTYIIDSSSKPTVSIDTAYANAYNTLKSYYVKMLDSDLSRKYYDLKKNYLKKAHFDGYDRDKNIGQQISLDNLRGWIYDNLEKTEFSTYAEAEAEQEKMAEVYKALILENLDLHKYLKYASPKHPKLLLNLSNDLIEIYGDRFIF